MELRNGSGRCQTRYDVKVEQVAQVVNGERNSAARSNDTSDAPASERLSDEASPFLKPGCLPYRRQYDAVAGVKVRAAPVQQGMLKIGVAQRALRQTVGKC